MKTSITLLVSAFAAQQVAATWGSGEHFNCPANTDNKCNDSQKKGWNWHDLPQGDFNSYGGHNFSGWKCSNGFGKRDGLAKRWGDKCVTGQAGPGTGPSISCGDDKNGFSIKHMHVQTEHDQDVEFHYKMGDGSTCKQVSPCKAGGNIVQNDQCGGAQTVSIQLPSHAPKPCSVGVYSVGFDCNKPSPPAPPAYTPTPPAYTPPTSTPPYPTHSTSVYTPPPPPPYSSPSTSSSSSSSTSSSSSSSSSSSTSSTTPYSPVTPSSSSSTSTTSTHSLPPYTPPYQTPSTPSSSTPSSTPYSPVYLSSSSSSSSSSTPPYTTPKVPLTTAPSSSSSTSTSTSSSSTPYVPVPSGSCPPTLPKCMNTWMFQTGCKDNGDYNCYCKQPDFASKVCDCLGAYGADEDETAKAIDYFQGICARYMGDNYGLALKCNKPSKPSKPTTPNSTPYSPETTSESSSTSSSTPYSPVTESTTTSTITKPVTSVVTKTTSVTSTYPETQTTVITTQYVTTCPIGHPVTSGTVTTTLTTPSVSTIYSTTTSTICTKCSAPPPTYTSSTPAGPTYASSTPVTTVTVHKTYTVPCTYSTGESVGLTIPKSSTSTVVSTSYTVPQVVITPGTGSSTGGLAYGPAPTPANTTPVAPTYATTLASSGFGTSYVPTKTGSTPPPYNNGALSAKEVSFGSFAAVVVAGLVAVVM